MSSRALSLLENFLQWFVALSQRERWLAAAAVVLFCFGVLQWRVYTPQRRAMVAQQTAIKSAQKALDESRSKIAQYHVDPETLARLQQAQLSEVAVLEDRIAKAGRLLDEHGQPRVSVESVVRRLAQAKGRVRLVSLKMQPPSPIGDAPAGLKPVAAMPVPEGGAVDSSSSTPQAAAPAARSLYQVGMTLVLKGDYLSLVAYLAALEKEMPGLIWSPVSLDASQYPDVSLNTVIYTLSPTDRIFNPLSGSNASHE